MVSADQRFPMDTHDHGDCVRDALDRAGEKCALSGVRLTPLRRHILELIWASREPIGAYGLLDALHGEGREAAPPTVYRALDFLLKQGLIHRLEKRNAFVGCAHPEAPHDAQFLICTECGRVAELAAPTIGEAVADAAQALGFSVDHQTVEVEGRCPYCRKDKSGRDS